MRVRGRTLRGARFALAGCLIGCAASDGPSGPPVLLSVDILDVAGSPVQLEGSMPITPRVQVVFRFDRLLEPTALEEIVDGKPVPSGEVAIIEAAGEPDAVTTYIPNGHAKHHLIFSGGPALLVSPQPTLPSGAPVKVSLEKSLIQAKNGQEGAMGWTVADGVSDVLTFSTTPFAATIEPVEASGAGQPLPARTSLAVTFNNLPDDGIADRINVEVVDPSGNEIADVEATVTGDGMDPTRWLVAPSAGTWPAGARVKITVDPEATDALGMRMAGEAALTFEVAR
jgi:hypothetical protein